MAKYTQSHIDRWHEDRYFAVWTTEVNGEFEYTFCHTICVPKNQSLETVLKLNQVEHRHGVEWKPDITIPWEQEFQEYVEENNVFDDEGDVWVDGTVTRPLTIKAKIDPEDWKIVKKYF